MPHHRMSSMSAPTPDSAIVSIGYERRDIDEFVQLLVAASVELLIDVRLNAISRKKGFSKKALTDALARVGIGYRHERCLGNPKDNRDPFRLGDSSAKERYLAHLSNGASSVLEDIVKISRESRVALLCFEREHSQCHRSCIVERAQDIEPDLGLLMI